MTELAALLSAISAMQALAQAALDSGDVDTWMEHTRALRLLERRRDREWDKQAHSSNDGATGSGPAAAGGSARDQARAVLDDLGVPASLNQLSAWHFALYGVDIPYKAMSSLRHDERASFNRTPHGRPWYVVPALGTDTLAPVRGLLALSDWPAVDRLVGPLTQRTAHLRITLALVDTIDRLPEAPSPAVERLLWRFASTLPGARQRDLTADLVREAANAELAALDDTDRRDRQDALDRHARLDPGAALFGAPLRVVATAPRTRKAGGTR